MLTDHIFDLSIYEYVDQMRAPNRKVTKSENLDYLLTQNIKRLFLLRIYHIF